MKYRILLLLLPLFFIGEYITQHWRHEPYHRRANIQKVISDLTSFDIVINQYLQKYPLLPLAYDELSQKLVPEFAKRIPKDSWGEDYIYLTNSDIKNAYTIYSKGENKKDEFMKGDDVSLDVIDTNYAEIKKDPIKEWLSVFVTLGLIFSLLSLIIFCILDLCKQLFHKYKKV